MSNLFIPHVETLWVIILPPQDAVKAAWKSRIKKGIYSCTGDWKCPSEVWKGFPAAGPAHGFSHPLGIKGGFLINLRLRDVCVSCWKRRWIGRHVGVPQRNAEASLRPYHRRPREISLARADISTSTRAASWRTINNGIFLRRNSWFLRFAHTYLQKPTCMSATSCGSRSQPPVVAPGGEPPPSCPLRRAATWPKIKPFPPLFSRKPSVRRPFICVGQH